MEYKRLGDTVYATTKVTFVNSGESERRDMSALRQMFNENARKSELLREFEEAVRNKGNRIAERYSNSFMRGYHFANSDAVDTLEKLLFPV